MFITAAEKRHLQTEVDDYRHLIACWDSSFRLFREFLMVHCNSVVLENDLELGRIWPSRALLDDILTET